MALSAADLQRRHELEGAPDPFPSLSHDSPARPSRNGSANPAAPDTESELSFPSLAPSAAPMKRAGSVWGAGAAAPRIQASQPAVQKQNLATDVFTLSAIDLSAAGKDNKPATLAEVMKNVMSRFNKVHIEASSNQKLRQTTFHIKSESHKELEKAKRVLIALLSPKISIVVNAPASTIASIIGPKGAKLKQIRDQTNVKIDIPRREDVTDGNNGSPAQAGDDEEEEITVPVTIEGPQPLVYEAQALVNEVIAAKTSKITQRVRDIPAHILPFVIARRPEYIAVAAGAELNLALNSVEREITASGDREAVIRAVEKIKATIEFFKTDLTQFSMSLPKRQHRLLAGSAVQEIMAKSKCGVIIPPPDDVSDQITVWGNSNDLSNGMAAIMTKANSQYILEFPLPGPSSLSKQIVTYMAKISYAKNLSEAHPGVAVYLPPQSTWKTASVLNIDIVGEKAKVDETVAQLSSFIGSLMGGTREVEIDWLVHRIIIGKHSKKIKQFNEGHNVRLFFPDEASEESSVLLVYDPTSPSASKSPVDKSNHLAEVEKDLLKLAKDAADVKSTVVPVEAKWHSAVAGKDGTTLNAIIGEEKSLSIKMGKEANADSVDVILVRGLSADVDRAVKEIRRIVENAENELIDNSHSVEFEISREYVGRIVGSGGAAVNKLRDSLGVKVDFLDEVEEREKEGSKKKKAVPQKAKVKITGRKENVEEAKKRILAQVERLADETSETLKIPHQFHSSLIGQSGKYVIRLEEKYSVKITFPREASENGEGKTRETLKPDEVLIKGGRKGVASAKSELMDAVEFEKESNNIIKFTVPTKSVARILGKAGANINEIKDETGAQIDVDKASEDSSNTQITCRGTKKAIAAAKAAILVIAEQVEQETSATLNIEQKFHRTIIGTGGQGLKDLVSRCGGPTDPRAQAGLIRFPNQSETSDEIRLRGDATVVKKLKVELEKIAATMRDRVVLYVNVPNSHHRALIGRNGQHLNDLQKRTDTQVQFPGSRSYNQMGDPNNAAEFADADPQDLVKVAGSRAACEKAIKELMESVNSKASNNAILSPTQSSETVNDTVNVPLKYQHFISQQGGFFRTLRSIGVNVDQSKTAGKYVPPTRPSNDDVPTRIDDAEENGPAGVEWQVVANYQDGEEGDSVWTLKARDEEALAKAKEMIVSAIEQAKESSSVGFLTLPDRSAFPRIVGTKGANVSRLRAETGSEITVGRDNNTIVIVGSESTIEEAKEAILRIANRGGRRHD